MFSFRRYWTFHLTAASLKVIGYSDTLGKVMQKIGGTDSVGRFLVCYISTGVKVVIVLICTLLLSLCKDLCIELFITSPSSGSGWDAV